MAVRYAAKDKMKIFLSYSRHDLETVNRIRQHLLAAGHDVWMDVVQLEPGDNLQQRIQEGLASCDAFIVVLSKSSRRSQWVQYEFTTIALQEISKRERLIIPVRLDDTEVPEYLAKRVFLDLSQNFEAGMGRLLHALSSASTVAAPTSPSLDATGLDDARATQLQRLRDAFGSGRLTLVCGAGISVDAGLPTWSELLFRLLEAMMERLAKDHSLKLSKTEANELRQRLSGSALILGKYLKNTLGKDFHRELRNALYARSFKQSLPIQSIVEIARPQRDGRALDSIITFNFDSLVEENLLASSIPCRAIYSESVAHELNELPIYHVHGYLPRNEDVADDPGIVFSEDAYHSQFIEPFGWSNLVQLNKLTENTCLFVGVSLTDPNTRRLLDVAWRKNPEKKLPHYIIKRLPARIKSNGADAVSKLLEEQDANMLGLNVVWLADFAEIPAFITSISR